jgi:hypothetical protein
MLSGEDIAKLCHGRIIYAEVYRSDEKDAAGPHYAVIIDSDEEVQEHDSYFVSVLSNDSSIDPFIVPVPARTGLTGFFQCSWTPEVHLPGIQKIGSKLETPEMIPVMKKIREAQIAKAKAKATAKKGSTHS